MARKARWLLGALSLVAGAAFAETPDVLVNHDGLFNGVQDTSGPAGGTFTYRVKVKHNAGDDATGVTLTEVLPEGAIYVGRSSQPNGISCSPPSGQTVNSGTVLTAANKTFTCNVGDLGSADGFKWVDFNVILPTVSSTWKATASASLPSGTSDGDGGLNNVNLDRNFTANDATDFGVALTSDAPGGGVNNGDAYNYTIQVNNYGPAALPGGGFARVTFEVPAGAPVPAGGVISGAGWTCSPANGPVAANAIIACNFPNPPTGSYGNGQALAPITVPVKSQMGGPIGAAVSVEGFQSAGVQMADGQKGNNTDSLIVQSTGADYTDVSLTKSASPSLLDASQSNTVTYTLQAQRGDGSLQPEQIVVTDVLPSGVTFAAFDAGNDAKWNCTSGGTITCTWDGNAPYTGGNNTNLPPINFTATVPAQATGNTITNEGTVTVKPGTEPNTANNKGTATVTFNNRAQLSLNKSAPQRPVKMGEVFQYTITITNDGPMPIAANAPITVTDTPSAALILISRNVASSAGWGCSVPPAGTAGAAVTCENTSALAVGASIKLVLDARVDTIPVGTEYAVFGNQAQTGTVPGRDGVAVNSTANVTVSEQSGDLQVQKTVQTAPANPKSGDAITYRISVTNKAGSTQTAQAIEIKDVLNDLVHPNDGGTAHYPGGGFVSAVPMATFPAGTTAVTCPAPSGDANSRTRTLTCTVDSLAVGQTVYVDVTIRPRIITATPLATTAMTYTNSASAYSPFINDPTPTDNEASANILLTSLVDLTVAKQVSPTTEVAAGQPATYTVTTSNVGPSSAQGVKMVDTLPANAIMVGEPTVPSGGSCTHSGGAGDMNGRQGGTMTCTWATPLSTQSQYVVTYRARSVGGNPAPTDKMDNSVVVSTTTEETNTTNNTASATIKLKPAELDVQIQMSHSDDGLVLGGSTVYTITVKNDSASSSYATGVKMVDLFPATGSTATFSYQGGLAVTGTNTSKAGYVGAVAGVVNAGMCTPPTPNPGATTGQLECVIPLMAPGDSVTIKFTMKADSLPTGAKTGTIFHSATVKPIETEFMPGYDALANNATTDRTSTSATAGPVDLGVKKQGPGGIPTAGDAVTYTITVTNYGQNAMSPAGTMTDTLPTGLNFVSASSATAGATCSGTVGSSAPVNCVVPAMAKGASIVYTVQTTVSSPFTGSYPLVNKANVTVPGDTNPDNDKDEVKNGNPPPPSTTSIPTLSEWGLILMSCLMGMMALWQMGAMRRRH